VRQGAADERHPGAQVDERVRRRAHVEARSAAGRGVGRRLAAGAAARAAARAAAQWLRRAVPREGAAHLAGEREAPVVPPREPAEPRRRAVRQRPAPAAHELAAHQVPRGADDDAAHRLDLGAPLGAVQPRVALAEHGDAHLAGVWATRAPRLRCSSLPASSTVLWVMRSGSAPVGGDDHAGETARRRAHRHRDLDGGAGGRDDHVEVGAAVAEEDGVGVVAARGGAAEGEAPLGVGGARPVEGGDHDERKPGTPHPATGGGRSAPGRTPAGRLPARRPRRLACAA
jgi:hypothetical protein